MMCRAPVLASLLCLLSLSFSNGFSKVEPAGPLPAGLTAADWREDLRALSAGLQRRHVNVFHTISQADFERRVSELDAKLPALDADHVFVGFASITASIGDGHTGMHIPANWLRYAVTTAWFGCLPGSAGPCELRITSAAAGSERALGARVIKIGDVAVEEAQRRLTTMVTKGETEGAVWAASTSLGHFPNVLHGLDVVADAAHTTFELEDDTGARFTFPVETVPQNTAAAAWRTAAAHDPISRRRAGEVFWWVMAPDEKTLYVAFDSYPDMGDLRHATDQLIEFADQHHAQRLVLDLRRNGGGDFTKIRRSLLPALKNHPVLGQRGRLYVLIGPVTYSAAMVNAIDFRRDANAILVGLPTGARPNSYSENDEFTLPKSGLMVSYSTRYYKFQEEDTPGVLPDQRVEPTWEAFRTGRDLALEWVLAQALPAATPSH